MTCLIMFRKGHVSNVWKKKRKIFRYVTFLCQTCFSSLILMLFYKLTHGLVTINPDVLPTVLLNRRITRSTSSKTPKYALPKCRTTAHQKSFLVRVCRLWNEIADELNITTDTTLTVFKSHLLKYYFSSLNINYDPENS